MKKWLFALLLALISFHIAHGQDTGKDNFAVKGFHLDLRIQVMLMEGLKKLAVQLHNGGINTLIMEYEATYPFEKHALIPNRYAYSKAEIISFVKFCNQLHIDVIPLQQSFGHVEYILRHYRYAALREDQKDLSQVCPLQTTADSLLFSDLYKELAATHNSKYIHIGCDETHLLGHCPLCSKKVAEEGVSKLYIDYVRMLCNIVIKLGKRPVLWADIALKYPDAIKELPKQTIFIDWNYGWDLNRFGEHQKLMESGFEIWGAPALRSHPDNYFLTQWEKHFNNIRNFVPYGRKSGYKGMVMTSWSTSGEYDGVYESSTDLIDLYALRHVYPLAGFNILLAAYMESLQSDKPLDIPDFIQKYCADHYGLNTAQSIKFWQALKMAPDEVVNGEVKSQKPISLVMLTDSASEAAKILHAIIPLKGKTEFEHYRLMADIRLQYLRYQCIEAEANSITFTPARAPALLTKLNKLKTDGHLLDERFATLNKDVLYPAGIAEENQLRNQKINLLFYRLSKGK
ncbi:MAG TPA: family 20 glycosylhydrolase [Mucilaginibacter sp.]|jgi:hypothetical protein